MAEGRQPNAKGRGNSYALVLNRSRARFPFAICLLTLSLALSVPNVLSIAGMAQTPYATIDNDAVSYNGPGRAAGHDLAGNTICIGLLIPLTGADQVEGEALRRAAQMAVDEENAAGLPGGRHLMLMARDASGPWGEASTQVVHLVFDDQAVAIITSANGTTAHLAEQVATKIGVPVLTLASDSTTTEINLPWMFRIGPTDAAQARAFAHDIYQTRKLQRVVLVTQDDHDGRLGGEEFVKAARALNAAAPARLVMGAGNPTDEALSNGLQYAQAAVIWSDAASARRIIRRSAGEHAGVSLYLCRKALEIDSQQAGALPCLPCGRPTVERWTAVLPENPEAWKGFVQRYQRQFGVAPGSGAGAAYDAVRVLAASLRKSGANRARLRDALAEVSGFAGAAGIISFDHAGNDLGRITLVRAK